MAKTEYEGIAFTSAIREGWQVSVTDRAESSAEAVANLEATIALMVKEGYEPFVSQYNKAEEHRVSLASESAFPEEGVVGLAKEMGGVDSALPENEQDNPFAPEAAKLDDESMYLGIKMKKPKVADCPQGYSYEIVANEYSADEKEIRFYNEHSDYPACTHNWKSDFGKERFAEIFPNWTPQRGSKIKLTNPVKLYVKGEGTTSEGNAYQNLKSAEQA